jgi:hypothetical protein
MPSSVINSDDGVISGTSGLKSSGGDDGVLVFQSKGTETARITATGNVGIGATSPDVFSFGSTYKILTLQNTGTNNNVVMFMVPNGTGDANIQFGNPTYRRASINADSSSNITFATNGTNSSATGLTERMRIDASGNLLVGTATSRGKITVDGNVRIGSTAATTGITATGGLDIVCGAGSYSIVCYDDNNLSTANFSVSRTGALSKASGSFKISHPLPEKSETHYLVHSFVEAPQADNIYRGKVELVAGRAEVNIDSVAGMTEGTFVALNREVQCFTSNESDWDAVRGSVNGNILTIECQNAESTATISWLVIGERKDQHMYDTDWTDENGKVIVEPLKESTENSEAVPGNE